MISQTCNEYKSYAVDFLSYIDTNFQVEINGEMKTINIGGFIDRVDKVGDRYRVIDYKSGKVSIEDVTVKVERGTTKLNFKTTKHALQLSFYALMFEETYGCFPDDILIVSLINSTGKYPFQSKQNHGIEEIAEAVKDFVKEIYTEMVDDSLNFTHAKNANYCQYCR